MKKLMILSETESLKYILKNPSLSVQQRAEDVKQFIERNSLSYFDLEGNNIGDEECKALAAVLPQCPSITSIDILSINIGDEGCKAFAAVLPQCPSITSINLRSDNIDDEGCKALAAVLPQCPSITRIALGRGSIGDEGCKALATALTQRRSITSIDVVSINIGDEGCKAVAAVHPQCPSITSIDFGGNDIGDEGCNALATALTQCPSLTSIDLYDNDIDHGSKSMSMIDSVLQRNQEYVVRWLRRRPLILLSVSCIKILRHEDDVSANASCEGGSSFMYLNDVVVSDTSTCSRQLKILIFIIFVDSNLVKYIAQYL